MLVDEPTQLVDVFHCFAYFQQAVTDGVQAEDGTRLDTYFCLDANGWHFTNADQPVAKRSERWVRAMLRPPKKRK